MPRPNILFLMSDEHRPDITGHEGNRIIRTPTLDALASSGVVFRNAYAPSPVCVPGRQCITAGQLPHTCNCHRWAEDLPPNSMTFARRFAQYAYQTVCAGKLHHMGPDQMQGWTTRVAPDAHIDEKYRTDLLPEEAAKYIPAPGTGKWSNQKEIERAGIGDGPYQRFDRTATQAAIAFARDYFLNPEYDRPLGHRPLLLKLSLIQPHYPFFTDAAKFDYYLNRVPIYHGQPRFDHPVLSRTQAPPDVAATPRDVRRATAAYYGMIETVDSHFRALMDALEHFGQNLDEWIILYTSDHGEMLGQHGIWEKTKFFEASVRVPLIIRCPKRFAPRVVHENVNLCDLFATLCDLGEVPLPPPADTLHGRGLDSRSLVPLLSGHAAHWNNESISQINDQVMIKRDHLKYQYYGPGIPEVLFDLQRDPAETTNLLPDPAYAASVAKFRTRLAELGHGPDAAPQYTNAGYTPSAKAPASP